MYTEDDTNLFASGSDLQKNNPISQIIKGPSIVKISTLIIYFDSRLLLSTSDTNFTITFCNHFCQPEKSNIVSIDNHLDHQALRILSLYHLEKEKILPRKLHCDFKRSLQCDK